MNRLIASLLVLAGGASYGLLGSFVKMAYAAGFSPRDVTSSQFVFAVLVLAALSAAHWKTFRRLDGSQVRLLCVLGVFAAGTTVFYYTSLHYLPASLAIVLLFQFSWIVMLIDYLLTRNRPSGTKWLSLVLVLIGTLLAVNVWKTDWRQVSPVGLLLGFLSSLTYGAFLYWNEKSKSQAPAVVNSLIMGIASVFAMSLVFPPVFLWNGTLGQGLWIWALLIGCFGQVIPPILFNKGIPVVGGALAGLLASIELPVAVVAASVILHEPVGVTQWVGIGLILSGIVVVEWLDREPAKKLVKAHE